MFGVQAGCERVRERAGFRAAGSCDAILFELAFSGKLHPLLCFPQVLALASSLDILPKDCNGALACI